MSIKQYLQLLLFVIATLFSTITLADKASVLFIGNSFTYANDMPAMLSQLASSLGDDIEVDSAVTGGADLKAHLNDGTTLSKIKENTWTFIVLQEQSEKPTFPLQQFNTEVMQYAIQLTRYIHANNPNAKIVMFETWGFANGDPMNCKGIPDVCNYQDMQKLLDARYALLASQTGSILARVGAAWWQTRYQHPEIQLYSGDGKHPSREGSYLTACVFYMLFTGKSPVGASSLGVDDATAKVLQTIAQQVVSSNIN